MEVPPMAPRLSSRMDSSEHCSSPPTARAASSGSRH